MSSGGVCWLISDEKGGFGRCSEYVCTNMHSQCFEKNPAKSPMQSWVLSATPKSIRIIVQTVCCCCCCCSSGCSICLSERDWDGIYYQSWISKQHINNAWWHNHKGRLFMMINRNWSILQSTARAHDSTKLPFASLPYTQITYEIQFTREMTVYSQNDVQQADMKVGHWSAFSRFSPSNWRIGYCSSVDKKVA